MRTRVNTVPIEYQDAFDFYRQNCNGGVNLLMESISELNLAYAKQSLVVPHPAVKITGKNEDFSLEALTDTGCAILSAFDHDDFPYAHDLHREDGLIRGKVEKVVNPNVPEHERIRLQNTSYVIRTVLEKFRGVEDDLAGLYGAFAYDFARNFEDFGDRFIEGGSPDFVLYLPTTLVHFDDRREKAAMRELYFDGKHDEMTDSASPEFRRPPFRKYEDMSLDEYKEKVADIVNQIRGGRALQCVLSRNAGESLQRPPVNSYRDLRKINPSPYSFFFVLGGGEYLYGASPELHIGVDRCEVEIRPIAGTAKRSKNPDKTAKVVEDAKLRLDELLNKPKERSEHTMLVDLARNDIYRLCYPGSVRMTDYLAVEEYPNLYHMVSGVKGKLRNGLDALHALLTTLPAGTLSGAPKREAMKMIEELEATRRNYYGGAVGYLTFNGDCNTGITIRSIHLKDGMSYVRAGAGIVAGSNPEDEANEILMKSEKMLEVLRGD